MSAFTSCYCDLIYKNQVAKKIVEKCSFCKPMNKLKPVPGKIEYCRFKRSKKDILLCSRCRKTLYAPTHNLEREKINEQNKYLDYLRKEIQDLKDRGR